MGSISPGSPGSSGSPEFDPTIKGFGEKLDNLRKIKNSTERLQKICSLSQELISYSRSLDPNKLGRGDAAVYINFGNKLGDDKETVIDNNKSLWQLFKFYVLKDGALLFRKVDFKKTELNHIREKIEKAHPEFFGRQPLQPLKATLPSTDGDLTPKKTTPSPSISSPPVAKSSAPKTSKKVKLTIEERLEKNRKFAVEFQRKESEAGKKNLSLSKEVNPKGFAYKYTDKMGKVVEDSKPMTSRSNEGDGLKVGTASCIGLRVFMEDRDLEVSIPLKIGGKDYKASLVGVFDGHGGAHASQFVKERLAIYLKQYLERANPGHLTDEGIFTALKACFKRLSEDYEHGWGPIEGTTATVAIILNQKIWVANVGDSRTILVKKNGETIQASEDAKPDIPRYRKQIEKRGGTVKNGRIFGSGTTLSTARAIGSQNVRGVSASPKITSYSLRDFNGGHIVLASDGLYDVATTNQVGRVVDQMSKDSAENIASRLVHSAMLSNSQDNVSVKVVKLPDIE